MASIPVEHLVHVHDAVIVRPGDKLVIALSRTIDHATANTIKERLAERLPGVDGVIIDGCTGLAAYRPDEPATADPIDAMLTHPDHQRLVDEALADRRTGDGQ